MTILNNLTTAKIIALSGLVFILLSFIKSWKNKKQMGKQEYWKVKKYFLQIRKLSYKQEYQFVLRALLVMGGFYLIFKEIVPVVGGFLVLMSCIIHYFQNRIPNILVLGSSKGKSFSLHKKITSSVRSLRAISLIQSDNSVQNKYNEPDCFRTSEDVDWQMVAFGFMEYVPILIVDLRMETIHVQSEIFRVFRHDLLFKTIFIGSDSKMNDVLLKLGNDFSVKQVLKVNSDEECISLLKQLAFKEKLSFGINESILSFINAGDNKKYKVERTIYLDIADKGNAKKLGVPLTHDLIKSFVIPHGFNLKLSKELIDKEAIFALHNKYNHHLDIELSEIYNNPYNSIEKVVRYVHTWVKKNDVNVLFEGKSKIGQNYPAHMIIYKRKNSPLYFLKVTFIISDREFLLQTAAKDLNGGKNIVNMFLSNITFRQIK